MAHQSLYRKYRPQTFADVVGQDHITRTLRNAIEAGTVAHAYLFAGPRGTGKTTTARLLAKAIDCEAGPTTEPDNTCGSCTDIMEGRHPDVYELDAASRTGVDNVREEIIGRVAYAPTRGPKKFYIIDEVHMLSTAAFNALLKTIEEPPSHAVFVLCTTHPHKVPETIQSRCQRFDFRRIGVEDIASRLEYIAGREGIVIAPGAPTMIARHAAGGMRDAISTFEQLAAYTGAQITTEDVESLLGGVDSALLFEVSEYIAQRDIPGCFGFVGRIMESGVDAREFVDELTGHFRDLFVSANVEATDGIIDATADDRARLVHQSGDFGPERLSRCMDLLGELASQARWAADPRLALEVALVRMCAPRGEMTVAALAERVEALESALGDIASGSTTVAIVTPTVETATSAIVAPAREARPEPAAPREATSATSAEAQAQGTAPAPGPAHAAEALAPAAAPARPAPAGETYAPAPKPAPGSLDRARLNRDWPSVIEEIRRKSAPLSHMLTNTVADADGDELVIEFPADESIQAELVGEADNIQTVRRAIADVMQVRAPVRIQLGRGEVRAAVPTPAPFPGVPESAEPEDENTRPISSVATESARAPGGGRPVADIESILRDELGAELISEQPADDGRE
jgi:DNA polymerase-3 subunit gamma/tau